MSNAPTPQTLRHLRALAEAVARLNPQAGEIGAGMLAHLVELAKRALSTDTAHTNGPTHHGAHTMTLPQLLDSLSDILDTARLSGQVLQADMHAASPAHREAMAGLAGLLDTAHGLMARVEMHPAWFAPGAAAMLTGQGLDAASMEV